MVSTAFPHATHAGVQMLRKGGNAVDAACAAALALAVCEPQASGVGGQTMAILDVGGRRIALDGSTRIPSLAHASRFDTHDRFVGYRATTVPSTIAVLGYLNFRYGRLGWRQILEPAIDIARNGYQITQLQHDLQAKNLTKFDAVPSRSGARYFLQDGAKPYPPGTLFTQAELAALLEYLAERGPKAFYQGRIAQQIEDDMLANDGFLRADDLAFIPWPVERVPLKRRYRDVMVYTMPPPAAGRTLLLTLMMLNHLSSRFIRSDSSESYHFIAEIFRKAFLLRKERPYDPNTYPQLSDKQMLSRALAKDMAISIRDTIDPTLPLIEPPLEDGDTTHLSVMDAEGNAIGITQSIELVYGSKAAAAGLGFLYNNYMNAVETREASHPYYLRPNGLPWTSVAPAVVYYKNQPWLVVGSPGSERIYSTISQFLMGLLDHRLGMDQAMRRPRFHCSIGGRISLEASRFDPATIDYLVGMGYKIDRREAFAFYLGAIHAVMRTASRGYFQGVAEQRRDGTAEGP
ncbi:MAG: gamma-glutamyltransferase [Chloroflexi bacterium]|nr:gamma-glutamyltransferase [Chloroflexota bacterium]